MEVYEKKFIPRTIHFNLWSFEYSDRKLYNGVYKNNEKR